MTAQGFEFFEHTADVGVQVHGANLAELFATAARAMYAVMGRFALTPPRIRRTLRIQADCLEDLLHDWLGELLYEFETNQRQFDEFEFEGLDGHQLEVAMSGATIDLSRSQPQQEIKAVTYHRLNVERLSDGSWRATVIFDV
jgi:SHS2 domain-containing protein